MVGEGGLEPPRPCDHRNLNPARLPNSATRPRKERSYRRARGSGSAPRSENVTQYLTSPGVSVARSLERRLERLIESVAGRVFSGQLHPSELAGKLAREADFARFNHFTGPSTANLYLIQVNPRDLSVDPSKIEEMLAVEMEAYTVEEGLRLEGPVSVRIVPTEKASPGRAEVHVEVDHGPDVVWARLVANGESYTVGRNRALIGRSEDADVVIPHEDVSRRHAILYRQAGDTWLRDLSSANGTRIDGTEVGPEATVVPRGSIVSIASHRYRFVGPDA